MSAWRNQNNSHPHGRTPSYYANHRLYPGAYAQPEAQTRTSRRVHDGFTINNNYGLDTTSDDINSSPYSSPYYINGRYNSDNLTTQRGNSASVQGCEFLLLPDKVRINKKGETVKLSTTEDFSYDDMQTTIEMWQGKQIKFEIPYDGKVVGNTIMLKNTGECTGILSIYFSTKPDAVPIYETAIDLCKVSSDRFEKYTLHSMTVIPQLANPKKKLYVRMEIWDEVDQKRSANPFNPGRKIEIAATGLGNHEACVYRLQDKNTMVEEKYEYKPYPSRPLIGLVYSDFVSVPVDRIDNMKTGGTVSYNKYRYDIFCVKNGSAARVLIYDKEMNRLIWNEIKVDGRVKQLNIAQVTDTNKETWIYYVDGYSPLQRFRLRQWNDDDLENEPIESMAFNTGSADNVIAEIDSATFFDTDLGQQSGYYVFTFNDGTWWYNEQEIDIATYGITLVGGSPSVGAVINISYTVTSGGTKTVESIEYVDARPVVGASLIMFHNNRLFLSGFRSDPNLVQISSIEAAGPNFTQFPYRFYTPNRSPYDTSLTPITAMVEYASDQIMFLGKTFFTIFQTYSSSSASSLEGGMPTQVSTYVDSAGVQSQGDVVNYKGVIYSFDQKEGIRRYSGATWSRLPTTVDSHYDRVDMTKPRKIWGYANKLYFNYTDSIDGKAKCLIWDMQMNYQQYPWFQDVDIPFCDARFDETEELVGIHPDYPCIMRLYAEDTWARLDTPIVFRRDTKYLNLPGNAADFIVKRVHVKIINNANRWWWLSINGDKQNMTQFRGHDKWFRQPVWDTITVEEPAETPFPVEDVFEENAIYRMSLTNLRLTCSAVQVRTRVKTFRSQANLVSVELEVAPKQYL